MGCSRHRIRGGSDYVERGCDRYSTAEGRPRGSMEARSRILSARPCFARYSDRPVYLWLDVPLVSAAFTYLVVLVLLSLVSNLSSLIVLCFIGAGCLNYFFAPPIYTFRLDYPQDLITISAFAITSLLINFLVTRVRVEQRDHRRTCETLRDANQRLEVANKALRIENVERKLAEQALREREAKIRRLVDANIIGTFIWDFDGRILEANEAFLDIVGYDDEDLVAGRIRWTDLTPPEWRDRDTRLIQEHKVTGTFQPFEKEYFLVKTAAVSPC